MKIAIVTGSYPPQPCGVGDYTERFVLELETAGIQADVITTASEERVPMEHVRLELKDWGLRHWHQAVRWMASQGYDIVHIQYPARFYGYHPALAFLTVVLRLSMPLTPVVVTFHEFRIAHLLRKLTVAAIASWAHAIIVTAESERMAFSRWIPWTTRRLHIVHLAMTVPVQATSRDQHKQLRERYHIADNAVVIAYFGFLHPNKGVERILRSFGMVHADRPSTRLLMICLFDPQNNEYHARLLHTARQLNIEGAIAWTGFLANDVLSHHLASADIGLFPFTEGVSLRRLSFMTAMAHGLPSVTTIGQVHPEEMGLHDGREVLLVPKSDPDRSIADRLMQLVDSRELRARLAEKGKRWAEPFQWESVRKNTIDIYRSLLHH